MSNKKAKDFLGNDLEIGDLVVFMEVKYRNFKKGKIISISTKMLVIDDGSSNFYPTSKQRHNQVIKIIG